jgi:FMN phosphatase YigB (HAD superfamily)
MIQGVLFDLFETLVTESDASIRRASSLGPQLGVSQDAFRRLWRSRRLDIVLGRSTFRDTLAQIAGALSGTPDERLLEDLRSERMSQKAAVVRDVEPHVLAAVEALQRRGLRLALVTNSFHESTCSRVGALTSSLPTPCSSATVRTTSWLGRGAPASPRARRSGSWRDGSP